MGEGGLGVEAEYVEVQPLKVDSTDESSLILPWEMRDVEGGEWHIHGAHRVTQ